MAGRRGGSTHRNTSGAACLIPQPFYLKIPVLFGGGGAGRVCFRPSAIPSQHSMYMLEILNDFMGKHSGC